MASISLKTFQKIAETLLPRCKNIKEPFTVERYPGDPMDYGDFVDMLRAPIGAHRAKAEAFILDWMLTGNKRQCSGYTAFVASSALHAIRSVIHGAKDTASNIIPDSGPPYEEGFAKNVVQNIMQYYFDHAMDLWVDEEAKFAYDSWKKGYDEVHNGPSEY